MKKEPSKLRRFFAMWKLYHLSEILFQKNMITIARTTDPRKLTKPVKKPVMKDPNLRHGRRKETIQAGFRNAQC